MFYSRIISFLLIVFLNFNGAIIGMEKKLSKELFPNKTNNDSPYDSGYENCTLNLKNDYVEVNKNSIYYFSSLSSNSLKLHELQWIGKYDGKDSYGHTFNQFIFQLRKEDSITSKHIRMRITKVVDYKNKEHTLNTDLNPLHILHAVLMNQDLKSEIVTPVKKNYSAHKK